MIYKDNEGILTVGHPQTRILGFILISWEGLVTRVLDETEDNLGTTSFSRILSIFDAFCLGMEGFFKPAKGIREERHTFQGQAPGMGS